jgi:hypothetical protein
MSVWQFLCVVLALLWMIALRAASRRRSNYIQQERAFWPLRQDLMRIRQQLSEVTAERECSRQVPVSGNLVSNRSDRWRGPKG